MHLAVLFQRTYIKAQNVCYKLPYLLIFFWYLSCLNQLSYKKKCKNVFLFYFYIVALGEFSSSVSHTRCINLVAPFAF